MNRIQEKMQKGGDEMSGCTKEVGESLLNWCSFFMEKLCRKQDGREKHFKVKERETC